MLVRRRWLYAPKLCGLLRLCPGRHAPTWGHGAIGGPGVYLQFDWRCGEPATDTGLLAARARQGFELIQAITREIVATDPMVDSVWVSR